MIAREGGLLISKTERFTQLNPSVHETDKKADGRKNRRCTSTHRHVYGEIG